MFNLSGSEVIIILILALVILGPDKLPDAMRRAGRTWAELRKLSSGFQEEVRKGFEEPTKEVKKTADVVRKAASFPSKKLRYNPLTDPAPTLADGESVAEPDPAEVPAAATADTAIVEDVEGSNLTVGDATAPADPPPSSAEPGEADQRGTTDGSAAAS